MYRRLFTGLTHEQYLDEPSNVIEWMVRIDTLVKRIEREAKQK